MEELLELPLVHQGHWIIVHNSLHKVVAHLPVGARHSGRAAHQKQRDGLHVCYHVAQGARTL
jgi:hypothetical protein